MAKPKAPEWLRLAFRDGVDEERRRRSIMTMRATVYAGHNPDCWLAQHDERRRPCSGRLERAHLIPRQRVEHALGALLPTMIAWDCGSAIEHLDFPVAEIVLLAAWDPRNAVIGCEGHHRRLDNHAPPPLIVPQSALPAHAFEFAEDFGLENALNDRFPLHLP